MIIKAQKDNLNELILMALDLWKNSTYNELLIDFEKSIESNDEEIILYKSDKEYLGFLQLSIRHDYVEGSDSSPVGYIEGVYVKPKFRGKGIAKQLVKSGEQWALSKGCVQMGSDIEQDNNLSYEFHKRVGYKEVNTIICFIKDLR